MMHIHKDTGLFYRIIYMYKDIQLYIAGEMCEFLKELPPRPRLLAKES